MTSGIWIPDKRFTSILPQSLSYSMVLISLYRSCLGIILDFQHHRQAGLPGLHDGKMRLRCRNRRRPVISVQESLNDWKGVRGAADMLKEIAQSEIGWNQKREIPLSPGMLNDVVVAEDRRF